MPDSPDVKGELRAAEEIVSIPALQLDPDSIALPTFVAGSAEDERKENARGRCIEEIRRDLKAYHVVQAKVTGTATSGTSMILL